MKQLELNLNDGFPRDFDCDGEWRNGCCYSCHHELVGGAMWEGRFVCCYELARNDVDDYVLVSRYTGKPL